MADGRQAFELRCAACHGLDGRGGERAPDIATRQTTQQKSDEELFRIIETGVPGTGMPSFRDLHSAGIKALVSYLRSLQGRTSAEWLPGDPSVGKAVFFGKARCSECHMVRGAGGFIAADLSEFGATHSAPEIREAIVNPGKLRRAQGAKVVVTTVNGQKYSGVLRNEDNFSLQMQALDGAFHLFLKSELQDVARPSESLMPGDYGFKLTEGELDNLVSFLLATPSGGKPHRDSDHPSRREDDDE
jgi:putative heme-binding domain-containing protein